MIKSLLNPKWQHEDASVRCRAIEEGDLKDEILCELAKTDPDSKVRRLAVGRIRDLASLIAVARHIPDAADVGIPASLHDRILAADPDAEPDMQILKACDELCSDEQLRLSLLQHAPYPALRQMAAAGIRQNDALLHCVMNDKASEVRRAAVLQINDEAVLREIVRQLRASDKTTARLADDKRAQMQQSREHQLRRQALLQELQAYADESRPLDDAAINKLTREWGTVADGADAATREKYEALQLALQPLRERQQQQLDQEREGRSAREDILRSLSELAEPSQLPDPETLPQQLSTLRNRWQQMTAMQNSGAQQRFEQDFEEAVERVQAVIKQLRKQSGVQQRLDTAIAGLEARLQSGPLSNRDINQARKQYDQLNSSIEDKEAYAKPLQRFRNLVDQLERALDDQQVQENHLRDQMKTHVEALESALQEKTLKAALAAHKKAHDLLVSAGDSRPPSLNSLEKRLHKCEPALRELKSWRNFGADHAREELIKEAVALRDSPPPNTEKLAKKLTSLRNRWKQLGPLEPGGKAHWEEFDAACTQAHAPVKAKHNADAEVRRQNLKQRESICQQLDDLVSTTDWEQPDWPALDKALGHARRQWNKAGGVPHKSWAAIRKRYDQAIKRLDEHLAPERERNFNDRQRLVARAEELAQMEDNRAATAAARELRPQWRVSVRSHHRKEKKLWEAFNKAMDQVFQKERAARDRFKTSLDENQQRAETLCEQIEKLLDANDETIRSRRAELKQSSDRFADLNLPKRTRRQTESRFDKACKAFRQRLNSADRALRKEQLDLLYALHCLCARMEAIALGQAMDGDSAGDIRAQWSKAVRPAKEKAALNVIEQRYQRALSVIEDEKAANALGDLEANAEHKRAICTDLEILLHHESPESEQSQRMQRQVELMENAMKGVDQNSPDRIRELKLSFMSSGPAETAVQQALEQRFSRLLNSTT